MKLIGIMKGIHHWRAEIEPLMLSFVFGTGHANLPVQAESSLQPWGIIDYRCDDVKQNESRSTDDKRQYPEDTLCPGPVQVYARVADVYTIGSQNIGLVYYLFQLEQDSNSSGNKVTRPCPKTRIGMFNLNLFQGAP
jgi:hypothetical protein